MVMYCKTVHVYRVHSAYMVPPSRNKNNSRRNISVSNTTIFLPLFNIAQVHKTAKFYILINLCVISHLQHHLPSFNILNPLNGKLNPICHLLALLGAHHILHISRIRVNLIQLSIILIQKIYMYIMNNK